MIKHLKAICALVIVLLASSASVAFAAPSQQIPSLKSQLPRDGMFYSDVLGIEVSSASSQSKAPDYYDNDVEVTLWCERRTYETYLNSPSSNLRVDAKFYFEEEIQQYKELGLQQGGFQFNVQRNRYEARIDVLDNKGTWAADGRYEINFKIDASGSGNFQTAGRTFIVDTTKPTVRDVNIKSRPNNKTVVDISGYGKVVVGSSHALKLNIKDLLPTARQAQEDNDAESKKIYREKKQVVSGVDKESVTAVIKRASDLNGNEETIEQKVLVDEQGNIEILFDQSGIYRLKDIRITAQDNAGNKLNYSLSNETINDWGTESLLVDAVDDASVSITVEDVEGNPQSDDQNYHRGNVKITARINDPWFELRRKVTADKDSITSNNQLLGGKQLPGFDVDNFRREGSSTTWSTTYALPTDALSSLPVEGEYSLELIYTSLLGTECSAKQTFGIDYTSPTINDLDFDKAMNIVSDWMISPKAETITLLVKDNVSGFAEDKKPEITVAGTANPDMIYELDAAKREGKLFCSLTRDGDRLEFAGTKIKLKDRAGNESIIELSEFTSKDETLKNIKGIAIDTLAPVLSVTYDNNEVANGKYYKAGRNATITIKETNFDLVQASNPDTKIVNIDHDGRETILSAKDFTNPSKDGTTWVATLHCNADGTWLLNASLTDAVGHLSNQYQDEFIVDTVAPRITVTFDNTSAKNGMYYNASRTASITVQEENFDASHSYVHAWAKDSSGSAVAAPSATSWQLSNELNTHASYITFDDELHYGLSVDATDLAGNVAETVEEPEFVIDRTAPTVTIGGVSNNAAYADEVLPTITYSDSNLDALLTNYELIASVRGSTSFPNTEEESTTSKTISFKDFEHVLQNDDVYTLTAQAEDMAGNKAEKKVRFSVNRFGSTYYFANEESEVNGKFISSPRDIEIVEINVSGLQNNLSHIELVYDSRVRRLMPKDDLEVTPGPYGAWTATSYRFSQDLFDQDGYYRILLTSTDYAGNLSQNTMEEKDVKREHSFDVAFALDTTAPTANLIGIASAGVYLDPNMQTLVDVHDNLELDHATLCVDGKEVASWTYADTEDNMPSYSLAADATPHTYELTVFDRAGNSSTTRYEDVVITGDIVSFILNTPRLLLGVAGGVFFAVLGLIGVVWALVVQARSTRELRNKLNS